MIHPWSPAGVAAQIGQYSHLAAVPADHDLAFLSGQLGVLEHGTVVAALAKPELTVEIEGVVAAPRR